MTRDWICEELGDRYEVLERLGRGATGEVYLARHVLLGRIEAIKVLQADLAGSADLAARFRREARAINRLAHPNIVMVYDFGRFSDGRFYLTMEYAQGDNLALVLRDQGPMSVERATPLLVQLADAVDHAHGRGVIHRDLKPQNLIVVAEDARRERQERLKVLDFGLAKIVTRDNDYSVNETLEGLVPGTPQYMAPERFEGVGDDPRSDIYSLGCVAYALLVGDPPFVGRPMAVFQQHMSDEPVPPSARRSEAEIPAALERVILRCLAKSRDDRYPTAAELAAALRGSVESPAIASATPRRSWRALPVPPGPGTATRDFGDDPTEVKPETDIGGPANMDAGQPQSSLANAVIEYQRALHDVAVTLLDAGCSDVDIMIAVAEVGELEGTIDHLDVELEALRARAARVEQTAREREAALRFSLAELRFAHERMLADVDATIDGDVQRKIGELETHLAALVHERDGELGVFIDREIELVAERARRDEQLAARCQDLDRLVVAHATSADPTVAVVFERLRRARQRMESVRPR